ncbi:MAG: DUF3987 domain-containing protein, partial [Gemmataceae bacterium]|nr:DUF3987 domain-containing protein [Gemmataceae bacterium]
MSEVGLTDLGGGAVGIPYYSDDIAEGDCALLYTKRRNPPGTDPRFRVPPGTDQVPYGRQWLHEARRHRTLIICEGESDCWTLRHHKEAALAIPGASATGCLEGDDIDCIDRLYILPDADAAGAGMVEALRRRLAALRYAGDVQLMKLPAGFKDVSDLHINDPAATKRQIGDMLRAAQILDSLDSLDASKDGIPKEWETPLPFTDDEAPPPFPVEVLPASLAEFVSAAAEALPCQPDHVALPLLAMAGGVIGASRALSVKEGCEQKASLYAAVISYPGEKKSPALELVKAPLDANDEMSRALWRSAMKDY